MFVFSAASDCSGWNCTNNYAGDSNSCTNWNSSEDSTRNNGNLHDCHGKILSAFGVGFCLYARVCVCIYIHTYTQPQIGMESSKDVGVP